MYVLIMYGKHVFYFVAIFYHSNSKTNLKTNSKTLKFQALINLKLKLIVNKLAPSTSNISSLYVNDRTFNLRY